MENFTYYTPTKVVFGKGTENQTGALVKEQHCKKVLIHYGSGSVVRSVCSTALRHPLTKQRFLT